MPQNWITYKLGDFLITLTDYHANGAYEKLKENVTLLDLPNYSAMIRTTNFEKNDFSDLKFLDEHAYNFLKKSKVFPGDILMNKIANAGSVYFMPDLGLPVSLGMNLFLLRASNLVDQRFLFYYLRGNERYVKSFAAGSVTKTITKEAVRNLEITIPESLPEQQAIASILSSLDDKIELNLQMNKTLEEMAMTLYKHWFVDFGPFKDGKFIDSELGLIPEGWEVKTLKDVLEVKYGKDHKKLEEGNIPVYGSGGIMRHVNQFLYDQDSILIPRKGTLSNLFYVRSPFWSVDTMFYTKIREKQFGKYIFYYLKTIDLASMDVGSAVPSLTTELLNRIEILIPQMDFIHMYDDSVSKFFDVMESNNSENQTLTTLRDTLLPKLISGEVRVKDAEQTLSEVP